MKLLNTVTLEVKKSKFIGYLFEVQNKEEVDIILNKLKEEHKKARHIPYAYKIGPIAKKTDDKEPSNTAGLPIYNLIIQNNLDNVLICVVRFPIWKSINIFILAYYKSLLFLLVFYNLFLFASLSHLYKNIK